MTCIQEEKITNENLNNSNVQIVSSTNLDGITNIIVGNDVFKFSKNDNQPSLNVTFNDFPVPHKIQIVNAKNVAHYNITVTYVNHLSEVFAVSKLILYKILLLYHCVFKCI